jgi:hypothetical protein
MKKLLVFLSFLMMLNSCFLKKKQAPIKVVEPIIVEEVYVDSSISRYQVSENGLDTSFFNLDYKFFAKEDSSWKKKANSIIADFIYSSTQFETDSTFIVPCKPDFFRSCLDSFYRQAILDYSETEYPTMWSYDGTAEVLDIYSTYVCLANQVYTYTGGAHPNGYYEYINIDRKTGEILKLDDIISDTTEFFKIAEKFFRDAVEVSETEDLDQLGFWFYERGFYCNNNFHIGEDAIHFLFNTYEIAPYAAGQIEFSVPFTLSKHLFKIDLSKK